MHIASHLGTLGERDELAVKLRRHDLLGMLALEQLDLGGPPLHLEVSAQPYLLRSELHLREVGQRIVFQSAVQFLVLQRLLQKLRLFARLPDLNLRLHYCALGFQLRLEGVPIVVRLEDGLLARGR